jgi:carboxypeptidase PM20D1
MNALVRTTLAITMVKGSSATNIIANSASAVANIRTLPGESTEKIVERVKRTVADDTIEISVIDDSIRSRVSRIRQVFAAVPTPYLMTGGSDALYYEAICDHVYRFTPAIMNASELQRMHNVDERFSLENLGKAIDFYQALIIQDSRE